MDKNYLTEKREEYWFGIRKEIKNVSDQVSPEKKELFEEISRFFGGDLLLTEQCVEDIFSDIYCLHLHAPIVRKKFWEEQKHYIKQIEMMFEQFKIFHIVYLEEEPTEKFLDRSILISPNIFLVLGANAGITINKYFRLKTLKAPSSLIKKVAGIPVDVQEDAHEEIVNFLRRELENLLMYF